MNLSINTQITPTHIIHQHYHNIWFDIISLSFQPVKTCMYRTLVKFPNLQAAFCVSLSLHIIWALDLVHNMGK